MKEDAKRRKAIIDRIKSGERQTAIARELGVTRQAVNFLWTRYRTHGESVIHAPSRGRAKEKDLLTSEEKQDMVQWVKTHQPKDIGEEGKRWTLILVKRAIFRRLQKRVKVSIAHGVLHTAFPDLNKRFEELSQEGAPKPPAKKRGRPPAKKTVGAKDPASPAKKSKRGRPPKKKTTPEAGKAMEPPSGKNAGEPGREPVESNLPKTNPSPPKPGLPPLNDELIDADDEYISVEEMAKINKQTLETPEGKAFLKQQKAAAGQPHGKHAKGKKTPGQKPKRRKKKK